MAIETNIFKTSSATADYVNPDYWSKKLQKELKESVLFEQFARKDYRGLGKNVKKIFIPKNSYDVASQVTDGTAIPVSSLSYSQIEVTFNIYGHAYQVSTQELLSSYDFLMSDAVERIKRALVVKKENVIIDALLNASGAESYYANGTDSGSITANDTLDLDDIIEAMAKLRVNSVVPVNLVIHPNQEKAIKKIMAQVGGSFVREGFTGLAGSFIGTIFNMNVYVSNFIPEASENGVTVYKALMLGNEPFAIAYQSEAVVKVGEDSVTDLATKIAGYEIYGIGVLEPKAILVLTSA